MSCKLTLRHIKPISPGRQKIDLKWAIEHFGMGFRHSIAAVAATRASEASYRQKYFLTK